MKNVEIFEMLITMLNYNLLPNEPSGLFSLKSTKWYDLNRNFFNLIF